MFEKVECEIDRAELDIIIAVLEENIELRKNDKIQPKLQRSVLPKLKTLINGWQNHFNKYGWGDNVLSISFQLNK